MRRVPKLITIALSIFILFGCKNNVDHKPDILIKLKYILGPTIPDPNGDDFLLIQLEATNYTDSATIVNDQEVSDNKRSGFFLISDQIRGGAIKFNNGKASDIKIGAGKSAYLYPHIDIDVLKRWLIREDDKPVTYEDIKKFLTGNEYSIIYMTIKHPKTLMVEKSGKFEAVFADSTVVSSKFLH